MSYRTQKLLLLGGIVGPALFALATIVVAATRPGYDHVTQFISELGETGGRFAWAMNTLGFVLSGVLILAFVVGARSFVPKGFLNVVGSLCVAAFAVCLSLAGIFSCDAGCSPANPTQAQALHDLVSIIAFPALILGAVLWGVRFVYEAQWRVFGLYSIASGVAAFVVLAVMVDSESTRSGTGLYQRLFLAILFTWMVALSIRLQRALMAADDTG